MNVYNLELVRNNEIRNYVTHKQDVLSVTCWHVILFDIFFITLLFVYLQKLLHCLIIYSYKTNSSFLSCPWNCDFKLIKKIGKIFDIASAFRILPVHLNDHELSGIQFKGPFYYDNCLPMGWSVSCSISESFSKISTALQWIACSRFGVPNMLHILYDFLNIGPPNSAICHSALNQFLSMCEILGNMHCILRDRIRYGENGS